MNSKKISELTQTPISTIRYYEKIGLLQEPHRGENNYRQYEPRHVEMLNLISLLTNLDFPLTEIKQFLVEFHVENLGQSEIVEKLTVKQEELEKKIAQLTHLKKNLDTFKNQMLEADSDEMADFLRQYRSSLYNLD